MELVHLARGAMANDAMEPLPLAVEVPPKFNSSPRNLAVEHGC